MLAASVLRHAGAFSSILFDIEHPATMIPGELSGRYLVPGQGMGQLLPLDDGGLDSVRELFGHLALFERLAHRETTLWHPHQSSPMDDRYDPNRQTDQIWARGIAERLQVEDWEEDLFFQRDSTDWLYYRTRDGWAAVVESKEVANFLEAVQVDQSEEIAGINGFLYAGDIFHNFVSREILHIADRVLGLDGSLASSGSPASSATIIPLEDSVVLSSGNRAVMLRHESGVSGFSRERNLVLERNRMEQEKLFPPSDFTWSEEVDGGSFERLIYDLLECEPGVREVRAIGASRERDGGRDIVASWVTPPATGTAVVEGETVARERRVIIQCKARKRSVGRSDLGGGILDTLFMYKAEGYFLAGSSQPAVATIDLLDEIAQRGGYFTGWWGRVEIEQRLRRNPQVLRRYADIVRPVP
ncbi:restriction endonuclease [Streptomyces niveus]|uniref:restriction endonuclease n=1 Tax=Streptomyces niveus TaxID=193462 RepID=UPI003D0673B1